MFSYQFEFLVTHHRHCRRSAVRIELLKYLSRLMDEASSCYEVRFGMVRCGLVLCSAVWYCVVRFGIV